MTRATVNGLGQGLHGDKTTTGATCLSSLPKSTQGGRGVLRVGDKTTDCPQCGKQGVIAEGPKTFRWNGIPTALHGARVECDCPAGSNRLIALRASSTTRAATHPDGSMATPVQQISPAMASRFAAADEDTGMAEPGFYIVPKSIDRQSLVAELFGEVPSAAIMRKFNGLNGSLGEGIVKAGQLVVLADPRNHMCMREEAHLMKEAAAVVEALKDMTPEDADFMQKYQGEISSFLGFTSTWGGVSLAVLERHLSEATDKLKHTQKVYQDSFIRDGKIRGAEFNAQREKAFSDIRAHFLNSKRLRSYSTLGDHPKLKRALGISTKSLTHHWKRSGVGDIPGYSKHIDTMNRATAYMKGGGHLAIGVGGLATLLTVDERCELVSPVECTRIRIIEGAKFVGASFGSWAGAAGGAKLMKERCGLVGHSVGRVFCIGVATGVGGLAGAFMGETAGELKGELIYEFHLDE